MDKYEISLWEDYPDLTSDGISFLNERKICVIGSNTMTSAARAMEPKLVSNVNGTNTFSFRIYYRYKDEITGEENINPYLVYIINERKVKVLWKDKWYDLVIKKMEEDTQKRSVLCTCEDLFISELSKNGYELEFNSELQNNSGTAAELTAKVLEDSGWQPAEEQQSIIQYQEESVYDVRSKITFEAFEEPSNQNISTSIPNGARCLIYYSCINKDCTNIQFYYAANTNNGYNKEKNSMLVTGGKCYTFSGSVEIDDNENSNDFGQVIIKKGSTIIFNFNMNASVESTEKFSNEYRAKRLVNSQKTVFDSLLGRYVNVYTYEENDETIEAYGYETTEYSDPTLVVNLIANPKDFKDTQGWIGQDLQWQVYPKFTGQGGQTVVNYSDSAKSYLKISSGYTYNTAFVSNKQYLTPNQTDIRNGKLGGFQVGEKYVFRYKAKSVQLDNLLPVPGEYITNSVSQDPEIGISCYICKFSIDSSGNYEPDNNNPDNYFLTESLECKPDNWIEAILTCNKVCTANDLASVGFFIYSDNNYYIEDIQFFKYAKGIDPNTETEEEIRINPGEFSAQSIVKTIYRYYNANHDGVTDPQDLKFLYSGETKQNKYTPVYNNYEKITSIEVSKSNRFNILQTIAEKFECWVRFIINHNQETGQVLYDSQGLPQKYVQLVEQIGHDTGISFEYGIDLKGIKRNIVSNTIATKAIIPPNQNEFGKNGFCTIARSTLNYCRENFILNFDYYIQQGLLDRNSLEADLYKTNDPNLGYYFYLNKFNREYDELASIVNAKQIELTKQQAAYTTQFSNLRASKEKLVDNQSDLAILAGVSTFSAAQNYASTHKDNRKVQSLMGSIAELSNTIAELTSSVSSLESSINVLKSNIENYNDRMTVLIQYINNLHRAFFKKYSRFIQEGTWQDQNYVDDDKYYLDGLEVAYRSSRPQIQYNISLLRLSGLEDFSSKVFDLGDICYIQDKEFFGYEEDGITPYKQKIIISQLTSYFDTPEKDIIKVQNYTTQFDDLFQRITTATQALEFSQGEYERAAEIVKPDKTLSFALLQDTFDYNKDLVMSSANQEVIWDNTGITVSDTTNSALKVKIMAGGIFASDDGGNTWKNALRGNGISTDLLTAGRINTSEIYVYDGRSPSFRWDGLGINAYTSNLITNGNGQTTEYPFSKFVRFDKFGIYGYAGTTDFEPSTEDAIWYKVNPTTYNSEPNFDVRFGLTWKGFFLRNASGNSSIEISTDNDILIKTGTTNRIQIGNYSDGYGMRINDQNGNVVFQVNTTNNNNSIGGWTLTQNSFEHTVGNNTIGLYSQGITTANNSGPGPDGTQYYILAGKDFGVTIDGTMYARKGVLSSSLTVGTGDQTLGKTVVSSYSQTQYYLSSVDDSNNNTIPSGGAWTNNLNTIQWTKGKYIWTRTRTLNTFLSGESKSEYKPGTDGVYNKSLTKALEDATDAQTAAANAQSTATSAGEAAALRVKETQIIYKSIQNGESIPTAPKDGNNNPKWIDKIRSGNGQNIVTKSGDSNEYGKQGVWTPIRPEYNSSHPALYTCTQIKLGNDTVQNSDVTLDVTTTVIDGAHITTGQIDAQYINVSDLSAFNATIGGFTIGTSAIYTTNKNTFNSNIAGVYIGSDGIKLGSNFSVTNAGALNASSGTFTGTVYAGSIVSNATTGYSNAGYFDGAGIAQNSIYNSRIASNTIDTTSLTNGVNTSLGYANSYNNATAQGTTSFPTFFTAGTITATTSFYGSHFYIGNNNNTNETDLSTHVHNIYESGDKLYISQPQISSGGLGFNIADTQTYKTGVSAAYNSGRSSVKSYKNKGYETTEWSTIDYTKLWIRLENDQMIGNIDISGAYSAGYNAGYNQGQASAGGCPYPEAVFRETDEYGTWTGEVWIRMSDGSIYSGFTLG